MYDYKDWEQDYETIRDYLWDMYRNCYDTMKMQKMTGEDVYFNRWSVLSGKVLEVIDMMYVLRNVVEDYKTNTQYMDGDEQGGGGNEHV